MKASNSKAELHQQLNSLDQKALLEAYESPSIAEVHFYKLLKPWSTNKKKRNAKIHIANSITNVAFVNEESSSNYVVKTCALLEMENSLEFTDKTNEIKVFDNKFKRKLGLAGNVEFLQEGTWIISINETLDTDTNFDNVFVVLGTQTEYGWFKDEKDDERFEEINPFRNELINEVMAVHISELRNLNGNSLNIQWGIPLEFDEDEYNTKLIEIKIKGAFQESLFHSIELQGWNNLFKKVLDTQVEVRHFPVPMNPVSLQAISKFWSMWMSSQVLQFGKAQQFLKEGGGDLKTLLSMNNNQSSIEYEGLGRIISAPISFVPKNPNWNTEVLFYGKPGEPGGGSRILKTRAQNGGKTFTIFAWNEGNKEANVLLGEQYVNVRVGSNNNTQSFRWNGFPEDVKSGSSNEDTKNTLFSYDIDQSYGTIIYENANGERKTINNGSFEEANFRFHSTGNLNDSIQRSYTEININFDYNKKGSLPTTGFLGNYKFRRWTTPTFDIAFSPQALNAATGFGENIRNYSIHFGNALIKDDTGFEAYLATSYSSPGGITDMQKSDIISAEQRNSGTRISTQKVFIGFTDKQTKIKIVKNNSNNANRLIKLLQKMVMYSYYYKMGFPNARYDGDTGKPLNMGALIKDKFNNTNYNPQQVITNLVEQYKLDHPYDLETEQWQNFMAILPMLNNYIYSDYNINGGLNDQHTAILPWYFEFTSSLTTIGEWNDTDNVGTNNVNFYWGIDNTGRQYNEVGGGLDQSSAWIKDDLNVVLKSKFFEFENNGDNYDIKVKFDRIDQQPSIREGILNRTYPTFVENMEEADISSIPQDINLSDDNLRYIFNVLVPEVREIPEEETKEVEPFNWINYLVSQWIGSDMNINFTKNDLLNFIPEDFADLNEITLKVNDDTLPTLLDLKGLFGNTLEFEFIFESSPKEEPEEPTYLQDGSLLYDPLEEEIVKSSFKFTTKIFNEEDDQVCRTQIMI